MTPSHHRVHHAQNERYIDKNYGGMLITWDRLFGTYEPEREDDPVVFGVRKPLANWNPFWANLQVYDYLLFDARKTKRWRDKIGIWFRRTGWRPADVAAAYPKTRADLDHFHKFDPPVGAGTRRYGVAQFGVAIAVVLWIGKVFANEGAAAVVIPCVFLWSLVLSLGFLNEARAYARSFEFFRVLVFVPALVGAWGWSRGEVSTTALLICGLYVTLSAVGLGAASRVRKAPVSV
jgi:hypothetical protein